MQKVLLTLMVAVLGLGANSLHAVTKTLIDFNQYEQRLASEPAFTANANQGTDEANELTVEDMQIDHWLITLNASARQFENVKYSYAKAIQTKGIVGGAPRTVLGARVHFPSWENVSSATISPPYEFPAYTVEGLPASVENGLVDNTGDLLTISAEVYGRNFDYAMYIQLRNEKSELEKYYLGQLFYTGWRKLVWKNPLYIDNVDLRNIKRLPIYPDQGIPYKKLDSFLVVKNERNPGGNFLVYVANVEIEYDLAILEEEEDIDQEGSWNILSDKIKNQVAKQRSDRAAIIELKKAEERKMTLSRGEPTAPANAPAAGAAPTA